MQAYIITLGAEFFLQVLLNALYARVEELKKQEEHLSEHDERLLFAYELGMI